MYRMSEALTPHLSREQYIKRYIQALQAEEANINFNFAANQQFQVNGETLGSIADQSRTLVNIPMAQLRPQVARMFQGIVLNAEAAVSILTDEEVRFAYQAAPQLIDLIRKSYPQIPIETMMFKPLVRDLLAQASQRRQLPPRADDPEAPPGGPPVAPAPVGPPPVAPAPPGGPIQEIQIDEPIRANDQFYMDNLGNVFRDVRDDEVVVGDAPAPGFLQQAWDGLQAFDDQVDAGLVGAADYLQGVGDWFAGYAGNGLKPRRKPIVRGRGLLAPVGPKHYIEVGNLKGGYVSLRNNAGRQIENKVKVGGNVGNAIKSVLEGKSIDVDDADTMNDQERSYLNHLAKKTGEDKLHLKLRNKTAVEKLEHEFEILRGQLVAGNDNPDIVKRFKQVIIKLRNMNKLSKPQVGEILLELSTLEM